MAEQTNTMLTMLKIDLGIASNGYDTRLTQILETSEKAIIAEGASTLDKTKLEDAQLIVMYAEWIWRKRDTQEGMSRMLRWSLNNRILGEKARAE